MVELPIGYTTWAYVEESDAGNRLSSFCTCRQEWTLIWARGQTPNFPCTSHCQGSIIPESTILSFSAELELHRTDLWSCSGNYFPRASTTHCFRMFWTSWNLCKVWHPSLVAHFAFALHGVAETCSFAGSKNSAKRGKVASCQWLAFQFLFFCPSSAVKIWSFDILVWKSLFLETEVAHLMVRWLTLWPGLKFLSSSRFGANRVLGHPLQWINVSRYPDRPEFYLSFATAMNVLFFCIPKNFQRLLEVTAYCLALWQSLQVLGSLMFFEIKPANRMLQTAGCRRGLSVDDKGRNHDIHGLTLVMQSKLWRILTRSCSFCALRFLWYSQLFLSKEAASVYFLKGTAWRSPKLVRWDDVGWWCRWVQNTSSFSKMDRCFASGGGFEGPGWKFTGDEVGISAFLVFFDHGKWLQMAAQICQVWSIGFGAIAAGNYDRFLTFWRIPYGFCLSALNFNCLRISLVLFSLSFLSTFSESVWCYFHCHCCCPLLVDCRGISFSFVLWLWRMMTRSIAYQHHSWLQPSWNIKEVIRAFPFHAKATSLMIWSVMADGRFKCTRSGSWTVSSTRMSRLGSQVISISIAISRGDRENEGSDAMCLETNHLETILDNYAFGLGWVIPHTSCRRSCRSLMTSEA